MSTQLGSVTDAQLREGLTACLHVRRWVDDVVAAGPFDSVDALVEVARQAATPLSPAEVDEAMADHPRIGERPSGSGTSASFSRAEQASSASTDEELAARLAAGNAAYEAKFGRVFLIRAAGRSREEILGELERRLRLDPETEVGIVGEELRDIALLRIPQLFTYLDAVALDHSAGLDDADAAR
ncbi:2-oxo-4-hydroxy-4-carboxy-5-ureidoimidazoline decarboxylase [Microlunatus flavus]|uniref:2-oxo-4-hydroxy-4-carboxy-5-ureidoimidazoline decarboxylase n=1 Tax=Microlunatus flavus TaxID=1036181 RepID=A0A1H9AL67_9ACTN|nr:2-oxo-4-hydroxy-4-carboxy-5-ureidoimidazoline decarboxylase [Microlunatus flavus]SEP76688.1 2-oxo-4-hydroxy-4-carboxy-5-ureidoimidazoline decarboxylase [Microlunatus flavus]